jgi:hypothetical protein
MAYMKYAFFLILSLSLSSCQFFKTEKISSETFYEEEVKTMNWNEVDTYPIFDNCNAITEKEAGKECFFNTIKTEILYTLQQRNLIVHREVHEKLMVHIEVSENGVLLINTVEMDSLTKANFPNLEMWIKGSVYGLVPPLPALKRGIPVKTKFMLPVVLRTE